MLIPRSWPSTRGPATLITKTQLRTIERATPSEHDGTRGCIMILDEHVHQLEKLVRPGVKLVIRP